MASKSKASTSSKRLFKCFCGGCKEMTKDEVERIYRFNSQDTLKNKEANNLLKKFLEKERGNSDVKSDTENYLQIYNLCEKYIVESTEHAITVDKVETLGKNGLKPNLEEELKSIVKIGDHATINQCLCRIQIICRKEIEGKEQYEQFKEAILNKLNCPIE